MVAHSLSNMKLKKSKLTNNQFHFNLKHMFYYLNVMQTKAENNSSANILFW